MKFHCKGLQHLQREIAKKHAKKGIFLREMGREGGFLNRLLQKVYKVTGKCGEISLLWGRLR